MSEKKSKTNLPNHFEHNAIAGLKGQSIVGSDVPRTSPRGQRGWCSRCRVLALVVSILLGVSLGYVNAQGPSVLLIAPVTAAEVVKLKLNHYFMPDRQAHQPDFEWRFTATEFVLKKGTGPIPADLLVQLLPPNITADEIRGQWHLSADGQQLLLQGIRAGETEGKRDVRLLIYKTASTIVRIGEPQYVFNIAQ